MLTTGRLLMLVCFLATYLSVAGKELPRTVNYKLDIRIDYSNEKLYGNCEITVANGSDDPIDQIPLLLYRLLSVKSVTGESGTPLTFKQRVEVVKGREKLQVNFVEIVLPDVISPGELRTVKLTYEGYLLGYVNEGWRYVKDHINRNFTMIRTDGFGYPVVGYPTDQDLMAVVKERYDYTIDVTIPDNLVAVTGGELIGKVQSGDHTTYSFKSKKPSWRLDIAVANYLVTEQDNNKVFYFESDSAGAMSIINALGKAIQLCSEWFGTIENYKGYTVIEIPEGYSSQADIASFNITEDIFRKPAGMLTIYHEISHLWNVKSLDASPSRFESEGLAQFLQFIISEKIDCSENITRETADKYLNIVRKIFIENPEYQNISIKDYGVHNLTQYSYNLGMVVFALFYDLAGQDNFNKTLRSFYSIYSERGATLDDFINCCKRFAPFESEGFFNDWIYSTNAIKKVVAGQAYSDLLENYKSNVKSQ